MALLRASGVESGYGGSSVIQGIDLQVERGSITGIIGPNGAGKSTFLKTVMGFLRLLEGEVLFEGRSISGARPDQRIRMGMAYVAQSRSHFPHLTVLDNLRVGGFLLADRRGLEERMRRVFERFPVLEERKESPAGLLSGGQLRMLEIGRFLMMDPELVLLDEPSIGLAPPLVDMVYRQIEELRGEGFSFLIVEQNVRKILEVADFVYVLETGRNRFQGRPGDFAERSQLAGLYLGGSGNGGHRAGE